MALAGLQSLLSLPPPAPRLRDFPYYRSSRLPISPISPGIPESSALNRKAPSLIGPEKIPLMKRKKQSKGGEHSPRREKPKVKREMRGVSWCGYPFLSFFLTNRVNRENVYSYRTEGHGPWQIERARCPRTPEYLLPLHFFSQNLKQLVGCIFRQDGVELAAIVLDKAHILYDNVLYFPGAVLQDHSVEKRDFL